MLKQPCHLTWALFFFVRVFSLLRIFGKGHLNDMAFLVNLNSYALRREEENP